MKIPGLTTLRRLTVQPLENKVNSLLLDLFKKFVSSSLKSLLTVAIAALTAAAGVPPPSDQASAWVWALLVVAIRAAISALGQLIPKIPGLIAAAKVQAGK